MRKDPLKIQTHVIIGMLILQYLSGMATNLFIQFPNTVNEKALWEFATRQFSITAHMILGGLLVIGGIVLLIRAILKRDKNWIVTSSIGLFALLVASFTGSQYIPTQQNAYSYIMAVAFLVALAAYGWGVYKAKK